MQHIVPRITCLGRIAALGQIAALALWACPAAADFPPLTFASAAEPIGQRLEAPAQYAFPIAAYDGTTVPARRVEGALDQRAFRLAGSRDTTLALLQPLRAQLEKLGYRVVFDCATTECGGFDFRFAMQVLPEPQMHVDLGDFRYLVAQTATGDMVSLLISRAPDQGFVQVTSVTVGAGPAPTRDPGPLTSAPRTSAPQTSAQQPQTAAGPAAPTPPDPEPAAALPPPGSLAEQIEQTGAAALDDLVFAPGKATLEPGDYASLAALADWLQAHPDLKVTLVGHTDATGSLAANVALSRQRAVAVRDRLVQRHEVAAARMDAQGAGYLAPRATNQTPEGRQKNRRVEVMLTSTPVK